MMRTFHVSAAEMMTCLLIPRLLVSSPFPRWRRGEKGMVMFYVSAAISLIVAGVVIGVTGVVCLGIYREERDCSITRDVTIPVIRGVRRLTGLSTRGYGNARSPFTAAKN